MSDLERGVWHRIEKLQDKHTQPIFIASPRLVDGDRNPLGIADAYWQDEDYPDGGEWHYADFDMHNDEFCSSRLSNHHVTHFMLPIGPFEKTPATRSTRGR